MHYSYNWITVHDEFVFRKFFNVQLSNMRDFGIISRTMVQYQKKTSSIASQYNQQQHYNVESEGVNFHQIKYIVALYLAGTLISLLIVCLEVFIKKFMEMRRLK